MLIGLQTPRLKRLAEIVSAQAIAQQEKLESTTETYDSVGEDQDQVQDQDDDVGVTAV